ncbi:response regulator transcription factor [Pelagicoccus sp. SDUM812003]|uniref:response regulator transcription factor n=1 Tax=Pelagicoccus sp. SDUM812003 TaxID=3041267 RepID=UPI00281021C5|nr:response regulator transcription factor [Pelagicoccus sp. SDUM812003]MDQ8203997.1 response regulator transcription factor [Pelagicoccus sp. SDUM812003]
MKTIRVGIVDDHPFVVKGLAAYLEEDDGLQLAWTAGEEEAAMKLLHEQPVDVVILDLKMGEARSGFHILQRLSQSSLETRALILSGYAPATLVREAAALGASAYFAKTDRSEEIVQAVRTLGEGPVTGLLGPYRDIAKPDIYVELSSRERDVLVEIAKGKSNAAVAKDLHLKVGTVKTHLESIYRKLGVTSRTDAIRTALSDGYFSVEDMQSQQGGH